ncbi:SMP-30/gluconolactonase/LRE family protein [Nocardioides sp. YIM 152315]|uniref:ABC transporter permease n=1 Tax=Nocardioides sp. YIM 152315 TaxID=3031760 RepID=UPI0023DB20AA|nr:SMP-30/gluconolactonase/LRE family protein [Nocardioides sp. YIM 152315]MDF1602212.1 SMP-30/gluconolactonase/LRE family protein [Nocardioides sp. YIM 152315]
MAQSKTAGLGKWGRPVDAFGLTGRPTLARFSPMRTVSDVLSKQWMEGAVPVFLAVVISLGFALSTPEILQSGDRDLILRNFAELGFLAVALTIVLVGGGIDLSVGSIVGMSSISSLVMFRAYDWPVPVILVVVVILGAAFGAINGFLIAVVKTRPFITTLVTAVALRAVVTVVQTHNAPDLVMPRTDSIWTFLGNGTVAGMHTSVAIFIPVVIIAHIGMSRVRWGWWTVAVGSDRRSARRNGVPTTRVTFATYVASGVLCSIAGVLLAARQGSTSALTGDGFEIAALTAVVLGGVSLTGGRGSVARAAVGVMVVAIIQQALIRRGAESAWSTFILAAALLSFSVLDLKWGKYRTRIADKLEVDPLRLEPGPLLDVTDENSIWRVNNHLTTAEPIGLGRIEGAEDCAVDHDGNLYCGDRRGWIWRFDAGDTTRGQIFARTGGSPLGHAWDLNGDLLVCVGGIGLCRITPDGTSTPIAVQTRRSRNKIFDDSAIRFADDLDVGPDGAIYFSDASSRIDSASYHVEMAEFRPNGRVFRYDPSNGSVEQIVKNHLMANGITTAHDGQSILIASSGLFRVDRLWISGPKQGQLEPVLENLPGLPDNINRASDGNYWMSFVGMRTPISDLFLRHRNLRLRMTKELPVDDWIVPQWNVSCVVKFTDDGMILSSYWDGTLERHPMVTSMKEFDGHLYIAGLQNNRIGRYKLPEHEIGTLDPMLTPGRLADRGHAVGSQA